MKIMQQLYNKFKSLNSKIAVFGVNKIGSMGFFYFCVVLVTIPILLPKTQMVVQYISSGYLQLIFLPLIMVGQKIQGIEDQKKLDEILQRILGNESEELTELKTEQQVLKEENVILKDEDTILKEIDQKL